MIPLLDLKTLNAPLQVAIEEALLRVARSGRYILGPELEKFESEWAEYCGAKHCIGTGNALEALQLILFGLGIGEGDEVIVPSNTYIATWLAVTHAGATPVPVEPDPTTHNLDPLRIEDAITPRTAAILAVHLYGRPADMHAIQIVAQRRGLLVIDDAAQAHGASYFGKKVGSLCAATAFSFYPSKNLGALGDAGCITTDDDMLNARARRMRNYGGVGRVDHRVMGINSRLDEMQAAILSAKLPYLDLMNERRRERAGIYSSHLRVPVFKPSWFGGSVWHQYVIRFEQRDALQAMLTSRGIDTHVHYPVPPHLEGAYASAGFEEGAFPIAERLAVQVLSLPIGNDDIHPQEIATAVNQVAEELSHA